MTAPAPTEDPVSAFLDAMAAAGVHIDMSSRGGRHPIADGKLHRAAALGKKNKRNDHIWYVLFPDDPASGAFGDLSLGVEDTWTAKRPSAMTASEKSALRERMAQAARERAEETARLNDAAKTTAAEIVAKSGKADPAHPYLARKGLSPLPGLRQLGEDVRYRIVDGEDMRLARKGSLVVPLYSPAKELVSVQLIANDGVKRFLKGTAKAGNYHSIGKPTPTILIGEGYATCARAHGATSHLTICAFDSGNLEPVAKAMRSKFPDATLILLADNDRFTKNGDIVNPGLTKARAAAEAVGGLVALPLFRDDDDASLKATDLDDLFAIDGIDAVRETIAAASPPNVVDFAAERARRAAGGETEDRGSPPLDAYDDAFGGGDDRDLDDRPEWHPLDDFGAPHFRCLGVDETTYFFQPRKVGQLIALTAAALKAATFMRLAPLEWWQVQYPAKSGKEGGVDWTAALNAVTQACLHRGKFTSVSVVRGRGAWFEGKTPVFHAGDRIFVDGAEMALADHKSRFVYDEGKRIEIAGDNPLSTRESRAFLDMCKSLRWASPLSGYMLAGLCVIAPVCGFLTWRPHVWIHGEAGSGKSTVVEKVVVAALGDMALEVKGSTTEPGIRAELKADARAVVFDESETKDQASQQRMRAVLDFARVAASEGKGAILKGSQTQKSNAYRARTMFVFASIAMQIEGYADDTRITPLALLKPASETPAEAEASQKQYESFCAALADIMTDDFAPRMLARTIENLSNLRENVRIFTKAMAVHLGDQRLGDQAGPLLAGAYSLNSAKAVGFDDALAWIRTHDWESHSAKSSANDLDRFIQTVTTCVVRSNTPEFGIWERTVGELIEIAAYEPEAHGFDENKKRAAAIRSLANLGVKVTPDDGSHLVWISTSSLGISKKVLFGTEWATTKVSALLAKIPGASRGKGNAYFAPGVPGSQFFEIPIENLIGPRRDR